MAFRGKRNKLEAFLQSVQEIDGIESAEVMTSSSVKTNMLDRDPLNQVELVDIVVAFGINLVAAYTYDQVKLAIAERAKGDGFEEEDLPTEEIANETESESDSNQKE